MTITPYIPPAGLSTLPKGNLLVYSQTFTNAAWAITGATITPNIGSIQAPDGSYTASTFSRSGTASCNIGQTWVGSPAFGTYVFSIWVYSAFGGAAALTIEDGSGANLANIPIPTTNSAWVRLAVPLVFGASTGNIKCFVAMISTGTAGDAINIWGAQLEPYSTPSAYAPTTSAVNLAIWAGVNGYAVLPYLVGQSIESDKAPQWNTKVVKATSGKERRTALRPSPLWQFNLKYEVVRHRVTLDEVATFWEFFNSMQGMFLPFLYVDPTDNYVTAQAFGTGDGSTTAFQLKRSINSWVEPVYAAYAPTIYVNGTAKTLGTDYTMTGNGKVTFTTAPAASAALTWTGWFYYLCRFDQDDLTLAQIVSLLWSAKGLKFTSVIP